MGLRIAWVLIMALWGGRLIQQNWEDIEQLSPWRQIVSVAILVVGAPVFMTEELLEIVLDWAMGEEES